MRNRKVGKLLEDLWEGTGVRLLGCYLRLHPWRFPTKSCSSPRSYVKLFPYRYIRLNYVLPLFVSLYLLNLCTLTNFPAMLFYLQNAFLRQISYAILSARRYAHSRQNYWIIFTANQYVTQSTHYVSPSSPPNADYPGYRHFSYVNCLRVCNNNIDVSRNAPPPSIFFIGIWSFSSFLVTHLVIWSFLIMFC